MSSCPPTPRKPIPTPCKPKTKKPAWKLVGRVRLVSSGLPPTPKLRNLANKRWRRGDPLRRYVTYVYVADLGPVLRLAKKRKAVFPVETIRKDGGREALVVFHHKNLCQKFEKAGSDLECDVWEQTTCDGFETQKTLFLQYQPSL